MNDKFYFLEKKPDTFQDFLAILAEDEKDSTNYRVLYRGQNDRKWLLHSTLARTLTKIPEPLRKIVALEELKLYFERNIPTRELLKFQKQGIDPIYTLGKYLQQNPYTSKIKNKSKSQKILTPFIDFTSNSVVALFFANYHLQLLAENLFHTSFERKTDGAIFKIYVNQSLIKKDFTDVVNHIIFHLKEKKLPPPVFWNPSISLNDLDDQKPKRQNAEYIFQSSLISNVEIFACRDFRIEKIFLKKIWFTEVSNYLNSMGYTINYLFPGSILVKST